MARFGQGLIQALTNPSYQQGMFNLGSAIGSAPAVRRDQQAKSTAMTMVNEALASQDPDKLLQAANAIKTMDPATATKLSQAAGQLRAKAEESRLGRGLQGGLTAIATAASRGVPLEKLTEAQNSVIGLGGTQEQIMNAYKSGLKQPKDTEVYSGLTEWVDANGNVALKTIQPKNSPVPLELGSNRKVSAEELTGLTVRKTPATNINIGKGAQAFETSVGQRAAETANETIQKGLDAQEALYTIQEARVNLEKNAEVLGFGSDKTQVVKSAFLSLMSGLGVSENDPLYEKLSQQTAAGDLYNVFTQEFVAKRFEATKGAISDTEYKSFISSVPNLLQNPEGYKSVLDFMERAATRAVLKADYIAEESQKGVEAYRDAERKWRQFSSDFPVYLVSNQSTVELFRDYQKDGFTKQGTTFLIKMPNGESRTVTYDDIVQTSRRLNRSKDLAFKNIFEVGQAKYTGFIPYGESNNGR